LSFITYKGHRVIMSKKTGETVCVGWDRRPVAMEELTLTVWGRDECVLKSLLQDALDDGHLEAAQMMNIWILSDGWMGGWEKALSKRPRTIDSVILEEDMANDLVRDAKRFQGSGQWYSDRGIPYRRGYCLYGPPGTGKTSFVQVLAGELGLDVCMLNLTDKELTDSRLATALREPPSSSLIMIEDIDVVFVERKKVEGKDQGGVTFSGLLNALDGVASQEGRILVMTTNHLERLDPALVRPGRVDVKVELGNASRDQARRMFLRFFPTETALSATFSVNLPDRQLSMAAIQGHLLGNRDSASYACETVQEILDRTFSPSFNIRTSSSMTVFSHLRRVGLHRYAPAFESFGYFTKSSLSSLTLSDVEGWIVELKFDKEGRERMGKLLSQDAALMREYVLADVPTIKEILLSNYGSMPSSSLPPFLTLIAPSGRGLVSVWSLRKHVSRYSSSYERMLSNAPAMTQQRETGKITPFLTVYDLLRRSGDKDMEDKAYSLEDSGLSLAVDLVGLDKSALSEAGLNSSESSLVHAIMGVKDGTETHETSNFRMLDYRLAVCTWRKEFGDGRKGGGRGEEFGRIVTCDQGWGKASVGELRDFLREHGGRGEEGCFELVEKELVLRERKEREVEEVEEVKQEGWLEGWLRRGGMEEYVDDFVKQDILGPEDLRGLTGGDLQRCFGVTKFGHVKRIVRMVEELYKEEGVKGGRGEEKKDVDL